MADKPSKAVKTAGPLVWVFEDQLSPELPSLVAASAGSAVLLVESDRYFRRVPFHKHRIAFLVSAMRHFALELRAAGREVLHYPFVEKGYRDSVAALKDALKQTGAKEVWVTEPSEWHTAEWVRGLADQWSASGVKFRWFENTLFLTRREEFAAWAKSLKSPVMEGFYRRMRAKHEVLMDGDDPIGGAWNLDKENRKPAPKGLKVPALPTFAPDALTRAALVEIARRFPDHPGDVANFALPVTRGQAKEALADFLKRRLPLFGDYEDAMVTGQPVLFHSFLSPVINAGLLSPMECIRGAEACYREGRAPLNAVEGFVRQILGWREYVYGIYWTFMPEYRDRNARASFGPGSSTGALPDFYWNAQTDMNCLKQTVGGLIEHGYTHHIQRLMILCNFATLAGLSPQAVNDWFYAMYIDSHDWVVTPNVIGMGMNADGPPAPPAPLAPLAPPASKAAALPPGTAKSTEPARGGGGGGMATKPYVSSGAYIDRMSDYCNGCRYDVKQRTGQAACPFNFLYWTFLQHYRSLYARNPRMAMMIKNVDRVDSAEMKAMMQDRKRFLEGLERGGYKVGKDQKVERRK